MTEEEKTWVSLQMILYSVQAPPEGGELYPTALLVDIPAGQG